MEASARRRPLFWTITLGAGLVCAAALGEIGLRVAKPAAVGFHRQPCIYEPDLAWGYRYRPNASGRKHDQFEMDNRVQINSRGWHDVERAGETGALRVAALGDSFTAAIHVPVAEGWTQGAEHALARALGRDVEVHNLGLDGTGSSVHLAVLERMLPELRPDVVVLAFFTNDFEEAEAGVVFRECYREYVVNYRTPEQRDRLRAVVDGHAPGARARGWFEHSYLSRLFPFLYGKVRFALLRENYMSPSRFGIPAGAAGGVRDVAPLFESFLALADEWDFAFVVVPVPPLGAPRGSLIVLRRGLPEELLARLDVADPTDAMEAAMQREGLAWADLYWRRDAHLDADGYRILGEAVAGILAPRIAPETPSRVP